MARTVRMLKQIGSQIVSAPVPIERITEHEHAGWFLDPGEQDMGGEVLPGEPPREGLTKDKLGNVVEIGANGAMQAIVEGRFDLLDYNATRVLAEVYAYGARKYAEDNWRGIPVKAHLNHAINHLLMALHEMRTGVNPEPGEDHLAHALTRVHMAVAKREQDDDAQAVAA